MRVFLRSIVIYFYPRPPRGGRLTALRMPSITSLFLSTPSARRATSTGELYLSKLENFYPRPPRGGRHYHRGRVDRVVEISIHALREEGDSGPVRPVPGRIDFYPRPPRGGRPVRCSPVAAGQYISIHALREEGDETLPVPGWIIVISIHALREEGDFRN